MTELTRNLQELVDRLVALHGEEGLCPTRADWEAILLCQADKPLCILNLLKFKSAVQTAEGPSTGMAAYANYSSSVGPAFARAGGKLLYFGKVNHLFGTVAGTDWDAAILTRYPSPLALANFWLDDEFIVAHKHRMSGIDQSRALVMNAIREA